MILIDVSGKVSGHLVDNFLDVGANASVVSGDVSALGVVDELVDVSGDVVIDASKVSASSVAVVHAGREGVAIAHIVNAATWSVHTILS
jgi:hypothetical protein